MATGFWKLDRAGVLCRLWLVTYVMFVSRWSLIFIFYQAARMGCTVDTVTLSKEQKAETEIRALEAGVGDRVRVHLCDYRELPSSFEHAFDGFVSCEMIEVHIIYGIESCRR
jgi:hypothetical protein